jgi:predicted DNA-binding transcriptional regulator AlpA
MQSLTLKESAKRANISHRTLLREIERGRGPAILRLAPQTVRVLETDLDDWIRSRRTPAGTVPLQINGRTPARAASDPEAHDSR